jgi:hypothetical protein
MQGMCPHARWRRSTNRDQWPGGPFKPSVGLSGEDQISRQTVREAVEAWGLSGFPANRSPHQILVRWGDFKPHEKERCEEAFRPGLLVL